MNAAPSKRRPVTSVGASFVHCLTSVLLTLLGSAHLGPGPSVGMLWITVILVPVVLLSLGMRWFCSALGVFLRDINQLTAFLSMAPMFASAVSYPARSIPPATWSILRFNPLIPPSSYPGPQSSGKPSSTTTISAIILSLVVPDRACLERVFPPSDNPPTQHGIPDHPIQLLLGPATPACIGRTDPRFVSEAGGNIWLRPSVKNMLRFAPSHTMTPILVPGRY